MKTKPLKIICSALIFCATVAAKSGNSATPSSSKQASVQVDWSAQGDGQLKFDFKTLPGKGLKINTEGPWSLEIKTHQGLVLEKTKMGRSDFKEDLAGFSMVSKPEKKLGKITYKMVVFVCTENKSQCFRDVQQGSFDWTM
ncbi:MAG: hypothetical protein RIQ81_508 [Pseudomonadota bacterium]|jgi:hypothetical protein